VSEVKMSLEGPANEWLVKFRPVPDPSARVFCLPHAGAGAQMFRSWAVRLPIDIELCSVRLPGRERRIAERPLCDFGLAVSSIADAITSAADRPIVLAGHCSGAYLAFELAHLLHARGESPPILLFVTGQESPRHHRGGDDFHRKPFPQMLADLVETGGIDPELAADTEMMSLIEPTLRADFEMLSGYSFIPRHPLSVPISVVAGADDGEVDVCKALDWRLETTADFTLRVVAGDHFFVQSAPDDVCRRLAADIRGCLE
jgi:surfactin synthase thioesterase subunit